MRKAVYPGSFDPITKGHTEIIERLQNLFNEVFVLVSNSPQKTYLFSAEERLAQTRQELRNFKNVSVQVFDGLTVDFAKANNAQVIVRGLRAVSDFEYEMSMANINRQLNGGVETMIVFARPELSHVSSRATKEIAIYGGSLEGFVSPSVAESLKSKLKLNHQK